jgi:hypothetical protein
VREILRYHHETLCGAMSFEVQRARNPLSAGIRYWHRRYRLVVFVPLLVAIALAVKIDSRG